MGGNYRCWRITGRAEYSMENCGRGGLDACIFLAVGELAACGEMVRV